MKWSKVVRKGCNRMVARKAGTHLINQDNEKQIEG